MNCIIVDDEPLAIDLLEDFISKIPFLNLLKKCKNAFEAIEVINKNKVDLIFLDINMPKLSGVQLAAGLEKDPMIIFTTAHTEYAVESYNLNAVDYLLKPFTFDRFFKAVNKAYTLFNQRTIKQSEELENTEIKDFIFVQADYSSVKILLNDILYIEGLKDYLKIHVIDKKPILTLMTLKAMEEKLPENKFIRVHRSFIVSIAKIESIQRNRIKIGEELIPVGDFYKESFNRAIDSLNI